MQIVEPGVVLVKATDQDVVRPGVESGADQESKQTRPKKTVIVEGKNLRSVAVEEYPERITNKAGGTNDDIGRFREFYLEVICVVTRIDQPVYRYVSSTVEDYFLRVGNAAGIDHRPGAQDVGPRSLSIAGDLDAVRSRREGIPHEETQRSVGERTVIVTVNNRSATVLEFPHGVEIADRPDEHTGLLAQREREVIHVGPRVDHAAHIGVQRQARRLRGRIAMIGGGARFGGGPVTSAVGVARPHLHVVFRAVGQAGEGGGQHAVAGFPGSAFHDPVGVVRLVVGGLDEAEIVGLDG